MLAGRTDGPRLLAADTLFEGASFEFPHAVDCAALARALGAPELGPVRAKGLMRDQDGVPSSLQLVGARALVAPFVHARPGAGRLVCIAPRGPLDRRRIGIAIEQARAPAQ
jgi:hypothetical protein